MRLLTVCIVSPQGQPRTAFVPRCLLLDFGEARLRHDDETDLEWNRGKALVNEDQTLACGMMYDIERVWGFQCKIHGSACKDAFPVQDGETPVWHYVHHSRFSQELTDEQIQLACKDEPWGLYEARPYPTTMAEYMAKKEMEEDESSVSSTEVCSTEL